jgi:hypothetical protein
MINKLETSKRLFRHYFSIAIPNFYKDPDLAVEVDDAVDLLFKAAVEEAKAQLQKEIDHLQKQIDSHDRELWTLFNPNP